MTRRNVWETVAACLLLGGCAALLWLTVTLAMTWLVPATPPPLYQVVTPQGVYHTRSYLTHDNGTLSFTDDDGREWVVGGTFAITRVQGDQR